MDHFKPATFSASRSVSRRLSSGQHLGASQSLSESYSAVHRVESHSESGENTLHSMGKQSSRRHAVKAVTESLKKSLDSGSVPSVSDLPSLSEIYSVLGLEWPPETASPLKKPSRAIQTLHKVANCVRNGFSTARTWFSCSSIGKPSKSHLSCVFFTFLALFFYFELHTIGGFTRFWLRGRGSDPIDLRSTECTIEHANWAMELFRPATSCSFCANVTGADRVSSISPREFEYKYAYSGRPAIITDAMQNWTAPRSFSFEFLKSIYGAGSRSLEHDGQNCLFFPYATEFHSLGQVFNMSEARMKEHWYIGWSNCDAEASLILRQHYQRPYFLPETAESTHADWLFMGTPGYGAHMHIDHVFLPSWQAQVSGSKRWFLQPPPECYFECTSFSVDVGPGEIIVLDTNKWYHQTLILPGAMSITIGSEYD